jgi:hypothetical protein
MITIDAFAKLDIAIRSPNLKAYVEWGQRQKEKKSVNAKRAYKYRFQSK